LSARERLLNNFFKKNLTFSTRAWGKRTIFEKIQERKKKSKKLGNNYSEKVKYFFHLTHKQRNQKERKKQKQNKKTKKKQKNIHI